MSAFTMVVAPASAAVWRAAAEQCGRGCRVAILLVHRRRGPVGSVPRPRFAFPAGATGRRSNSRMGGLRFEKKPVDGDFAKLHWVRGATRSVGKNEMPNGPTMALKQFPSSIIFFVAGWFVLSAVLLCGRQAHADGDAAAGKTVFVAHIAEECCLINVRRPGDGPLSRGRRIYLATVRAETLNPSLVSSAWILR